MHWLYATGLSHRLRTALKALGAERGIFGWDLPDKVDIPTTCHGEEYYAALRATTEALNKRFKGEGEFRSHTWLSD